ncbi:MAG: class I SAM-dependent methyltransferase [Bacteroidota bacterium]|nr:class I SAM-dependent methyltransferase [Bacteroidota bacterium]
MRKLEQLALSIQHYFQSKGKYRLHSELAYRLYTEVHNEQKVVFSDHWNSPWSKDLSPYTKTDFGTGQDQRLIDVVKHKNAASTKLEVQRLHNLVSFCKARNILELGGHFGRGTFAMGSALNQEGKNITSIEGCPKTIEVAKVYLNEGGLCNYAILEGSFTSVLKDLSKTKKTYDLIYIDGHHTAEALLDLIPMCQSLLNEKGVIAVDDIFWNYAVHKAWRKSIERTKPWASFEFLNFGYMFFDTKGLNQQFFKLW